MDDQYTTMVRALFKRDDFKTGDQAAMHAAIGIAGEGGEVLDAVKRGWAYRKEIDRNNVIEELGDLEFYMEALRIELGITREETLAVNEAKLTQRYHSGKYSDSHAQERADKQ